jgi:hypothetical protein
MSLKALADKVLSKHNHGETDGDRKGNLVPKAVPGEMRGGTSPETRESVPSVPLVPHVPGDFEERAALVEVGAGVPRDWAEGFAKLCVMAAPDGVPLHKWSRLIDNAGQFVDRWAVEVRQLGWRAEELFGCHPHKPDARLDLQGLIWLVGDGEVISVTKDAISLRSRTGQVLAFRRRVPDPREPIVMAWKLAISRSNE